MAKLWDYFDGEPFLENPHLGLALLNRAKKGKRMAVRRRKSARRGRKNTARRRTRRTRARRNTYPMAGLVVNPRRRKRSHSRRNPRRRMRSRARRNPGFRLPAIAGFAPLNKILFAGVGFVAPPMIEGFLAGFLPESITSNKWGKLAIRALSVFGLTYAVRRFVGREEGNMVAIGGGVFVAASLVNELSPGTIPWPQLGMYTPARGGLRAYTNSTNVTAMPIGGSVGLPFNPAPQPKYHRSSR